jgi:hypothetical protein
MVVYCNNEKLLNPPRVFLTFWERLCNFGAKKLKIKKSFVIIPFSDYSLMAFAHPMVGQKRYDEKKMEAANAHR